MTPAELSALHQAAFVHERGWSAAEFADLLQNRFVTLHHRPHGFALSRTLAGESELLTLAVDPAFQGRGLGRQLLRDWIASAAGNAETAFLEVASDNHAALSLYASEGFDRSGLRRGYYARSGAPFADAILMRRQLTHGQQPE